MRRALITGITGQDGSYLAEFLLARGYVVHGVVRQRDATQSHPRLHLHVIDLSDIEQLPTRLVSLLTSAQPDEIYHLAAHSHVHTSHELAGHAHRVNASATQLLVQAILDSGLTRSRLFFASTGHVFAPSTMPLDEAAVIDPQSPYAAAKWRAHQHVVDARERHGLYAACGIAFNHESPRRTPAFVTRKITQGVAAIAQGRAESLQLSNVTGVRDWGFAPEYVEAYWSMLQQPGPDDFVLATGVGTSVADFCDAAFSHVGLRWRDYVRTDDGHASQPRDLATSIGDPRKAERVLSWRAHTTAQQVAQLMVTADLEAGRAQA